MRELIYTKGQPSSLVDPVVDALADIVEGKLYKCLYGTGIGGYVTQCLDNGDTSILADLPVKLKSGHGSCTAMTDPEHTTNDYLYFRTYNQVMLHHLDSSRDTVESYSQEDIDKGKAPPKERYRKIDIYKDEVPF